MADEVEPEKPARVEGDRPNELAIDDDAAMAFSDEMSPYRRGYMPLFCAVHWIASQGGAMAVTVKDESAWRAACRELTDGISDAAVSAIAVHGTIKKKANRKKPRPVSPALFAGVAINCSFVPSNNWIASALSHDFILDCSPYSDEDNWRDGCGDVLRDRDGSYFERIQVKRSDVAKLWPFASDADRTEPVVEATANPVGSEGCAEGLAGVPAADASPAPSEAIGSECDDRGRLTKPDAIAAILFELYPEGRPAMTNPELVKIVKSKSQNIGSISTSTMTRACTQLGWARQSNKPNSAK